MELSTIVNHLVIRVYGILAFLKSDSLTDHPASFAHSKVNFKIPQKINHLREQFSDSARDKRMQADLQQCEIDARKKNQSFGLMYILIRKKNAA